jgi:TetR/AcrR family transcriptional regulator, regulator of cefoperazone and chloramphenicol sensitivity
MTPATNTRDRILEVARDLFAQHGYNGTTVRDIAIAAEANLAAVGYHFGSKDALYAEILRAHVGPLARRIAWACRAPRPPLDRIEFIVRGVFEHIQMRPHMPALMVRELAGGHGHGREISPVLINTFREALPLIVRVITEGQRDGSIRAGDPVLLGLSVMAQPIYFNLARPIIAAVAGLEPLDEATSQRMADHAVAVIRAGLAAPAPDAAVGRAAAAKRPPKGARPRRPAPAKRGSAR